MQCGGMLFITLFLTYEFSDIKRMIFALLIGMGYAASDEIHQLFIAGRSGQVIDVFIDTIGVAIGICLLMIIYKVIQNAVIKKKGRRLKINKNTFLKIFLGIILIIWLIIIFIFSSQTGRQSSKVSKRVTKELLKIKDTISVVIENYEDTNEIVIKGIETNPITNKRIDKWEFKVRKLAHYGLFACGGIIIYLILEAFDIKHKILIAIFLGMLFASIDEYHQLYSAGRGPQIRDVVIDTIGVISGVMFSYLITKCIKKIYIKFEKGKKLYDKFQKSNRGKNCKSS